MHKYSALPTNLVRDWQRGAPDAYGQTPERSVSNGHSNPCRHCLQNIEEGAGMLILAHRPFGDLQPYAETGPIFVCADLCERGSDTAPPSILATSPDYLIKGYSDDERIVYGTGEVVDAGTLEHKVSKIFDDPNVAFIHVRSARNNCYQLRVDRA